MIRLNKNPHLRIVSDVVLVLEKDLELVNPLAGRLKLFHKNCELHDKGPRYICLNKRLQNILFG